MDWRQQEPSETYEQYRTQLLTLEKNYAFSSSTLEEILRDRLIFGISNEATQEKLLQERDLTLEKTDEICRAAEVTQTRLKALERLQTEQATVHAVERKMHARRTDHAEKRFG